MAQQNFLDVTRRSVAQLKKHWDQSELDIRPPFQRNPVWSEKQKSFLVDTILRGYPIPEILYARGSFSLRRATICDRRRSTTGSSMHGVR